MIIWTRGDRKRICILCGMSSSSWGHVLQHICNWHLSHNPHVFGPVTILLTLFGLLGRLTWEEACCAFVLFIVNFKYATCHTDLMETSNWFQLTWAIEEYGYFSSGGIGLKILNGIDPILEIEHEWIMHATRFGLMLRMNIFFLELRFGRTREEIVQFCETIFPLSAGHSQLVTLLLF